MDDVQLANYVAGSDPGPVEAGRVEGPIAKHLKVPEGTKILLSDYNLTKTKFKHSEITFQDYRVLPQILKKGFVAPGNKKRSVAIVYIDTATTPHRLWSVSIKATSDSRVFLTMIHAYNLKDARRVYRRATKRGNLIRDHHGQMARRQLQRAISM